MNILLVYLYVCLRTKEPCYSQGGTNVVLIDSIQNYT